ncbi:S-layer homology domain-containing protein [Heliomicrobium modesticaldum]|uniref:S-layer homology domain-containing protein n=1 Tax=Heliomicrobium modesticaldum TaxID=35701 RepID=UPI000673D81F|nr:S-layer homology domain-containing protein [Heliomicrobium modesticaldum]
MHYFYRANQSGRKTAALAMVFLLLWSLCLPLFTAHAASGVPSVQAGQLAGKAVDFICNQVKSGEPVDGYTAAVLIAAKEDLGAAKWTPPYSLSVKEQRISEADALAIGPELGSKNNLITYLLANQNSDGSFGPFANEYGTKVSLEALARIKSDVPVGPLKERVEQAIEKGVHFLRERFAQSDEAYSNTGFASFDARFVSALALAGEDLTQAYWQKKGKTLREQAVADAVYAADNPDGKSVTELSKHLTALYQLEPNHEKINALAEAIRNQKQTVDDGVRFGASLYDDVAVLQALGQSNQLAGIEPAKVLNYINRFRTDHSDDWGTPAGSAYGSYSPKEPELTAQVLSALSGFRAGADIDKAIDAIQTYLKAIQHKDTAAIPVSGDSTTATAETLIALKRLGLPYEQYGGDDGGWSKAPRVKPLALSLMAMQALQEKERAHKLADLLLARHTAQDGFSNSIYSDSWAYLALEEAGKIAEIKESARAYLLNKQRQNESDKGAWGESFGGAFYADFMSTAQAIRALKGLPGMDGDAAVQQAIADGLAYLKSKQQADGSFGGSFDDPVVDTAEMIVTMQKLGLNPGELKNSNQQSPVDWMLTKALNKDGSFGGSKNVFGATEALAAYLVLNGLPSGVGSDGGITPQDDTADVYVAVIGRSGERLFGPAAVKVSLKGRWGMTVLGALERTGLHYADRGGFVTSIAGQANQGMSGWMYKVNEVTPMAAAKDQAVKSGDEVIWWYSVDMNNPGPTWDDVISGKSLGSVPQPTNTVPTSITEQIKHFPQVLQASDKAIQALERLKKEAASTALAQERPVEAIDSGLVALVVVGEFQPLTEAAYQQQQREQADNRLLLQQEVQADQGAVIADAKGEVALAVPAKALRRDMKVTIQETAPPSATEQSAQQAPAGFRFLSSLYRFGPDGTTFAEPVTVALRVALPPEVSPKDVSLAVFDVKSKAWMAVPAVYDAVKGVFLTQLRHFSDYAVLARAMPEALPVMAKVQAPFADLTGFEWAAESIRRLSEADILRGVAPDRFEPGRTVTRAEFTALLVRSRRLPTSGQANFCDVQPGDWFAPVVAAAAEAGIVNGDPDGAFRPHDRITREEMAVMLGKSLRWQQTETGGAPFTDQEAISLWARPWVAQAVKQGLLRRYEDGSFRPRAEANRAEAATLIDKLVQ